MKHKWKNDDGLFAMPDFTYCTVCNTLETVYNTDALCPGPKVVDENDIVYRLRKRAEIRRQIPDRKSVQEGKPDRIADILEEAADEIEKLRKNQR